MTIKYNEKLETYVKDIDKIAVFIDGYNTMAAAKRINMRIDWLKLSDMLRYLGRLSTVNFYISTATFNVDNDHRSLTEWLSHNGYKVILGEGHNYSITDGMNKKSYTKTGYDTKLVTDAINSIPTVDKILLFSCSDEYIPLVEHLQTRGIAVAVITNSLGKLNKMKEDGKITSVGTVASDLIRCANEFFELDDLRDALAKVEE